MRLSLRHLRGGHRHGTEKKPQPLAPGGKETAPDAEGARRGPRRRTGCSRLRPPWSPRAAAPDKPASSAQRNRDTPVPAVFLSRRKLNGESSAKETHHVESTSSRSGVTYEPGDAFGVFPNNPVPLVKAIGRTSASAQRADPAEGARSLGDWLTTEGVSPAPDALFALLPAVAPDAKERQRLERMAEGEDADGYDVLAACIASRTSRRRSTGSSRRWSRCSRGSTPSRRRPAPTLAASA